MARSARELIEEAMSLGPEERATLMRLLIETLDTGSGQAIPWEELRARLYAR